MKKLLELKDGFVYDIEDGFDHCVTGCPTCGLDDEYISSITFYCMVEEKSQSITIETIDFCKFDFSVSDVLKLLLNNIAEIKTMTHTEFKTWLEDNLLS